MDLEALEEEQESGQRKWDRRFIELARHVANWSKDPSTKVGAVIVDQQRRVVSLGFNGFPRGVHDHKERYNHRETKYSMVVHAEANAILTARVPLEGTTLYSSLLPCNECAKLIIQSGIRRVVAPVGRDPEKWIRSFETSRRMFEEAEVKVELPCHE